MNDCENNTLKFHVEVYEKFLIVDALRQAAGNAAHAAEILGTTQRILNYKIRKYRINPSAFGNGKRKRRGIVKTRQAETEN